MPEMIDGVPACYGRIESMIIPFGALCLQCKHLKGCQEYSEELRKSWTELLRRGTRRKL